MKDANSNKKLHGETYIVGGNNKNSESSTDTFKKNKAF